MAKEQKSFSFPLLKAGDVLSCMSELQIKLTAAELNEAPAEAVLRVYEHVIDICMGVTKDELDQPAAAGLEALEHGELHEDSIPQLAFFRVVSKLMAVCDVQDFSLKDITEPDPKRFRRQLSGIINFVKFREDRLLMYTEQSKATDALTAELLKKKDELAELRERLNEEKSKAAAEADAHEELDADIERVEEEIERLNQEQAKQKFEMKAMKKKRDDLRDEIQGVEFHMQNEKAKIDVLERQVVHSPRRIKRDIEHIAAQLKQEKVDTADMQRQMRMMDAKMAMVEKALADASKVKAVMGEVEGEFHKVAAATQVVEERRMQLQTNGAELEEVASQRQAWQKQLHRLEEKAGRNAADNEMKAEAAKQALEAASAELAEEKAERAEIKAAAEATDAELRSVQQQIEDEREAAEVSVNTAVDNFKSLRDEVQGYNRQLLGEMTNAGGSA
eukprot:g4684.t1